MMNRIDREKNTIRQMIELYCCHKEAHSELCNTCGNLLVYAYKRLDACRFGNAKPACRRCPVHCYAPARRTQIQAVMRYAGPRMLFYHPAAVIRHLLKR